MSVPTHVKIATAVGTLGLVAASLTAGAASSTAAPSAESAPKPTVVLVHGAWADGSSWSAVTADLIRRGYTVDVVPNPLRGVKADADYLKAYLSTVSGPIVLVGHSYGGMVTTNAATGNANVKALVYIDAYIPDQGQSVNSLSAGSALTGADVFSTPVPLDDQGTDDYYIRQDKFPAIFVAGAPRQTAAVLAAGQRPLVNTALAEASPYVPAWKTIPSYDLIGTADKVIPPANQQAMAAHAGAKVVKVRAPHLSMVTDPCAVTSLIVTAATAR
ncbi:alpha/beta fold hydrolase [Jatrophihabitans sp. YIM 134969]